MSICAKIDPGDGVQMQKLNRIKFEAQREVKITGKNDRDSPWESLRNRYVLSIFHKTLGRTLVEDSGFSFDL